MLVESDGLIILCVHQHRTCGHIRIQRLAGGICKERRPQSPRVPRERLQKETGLSFKAEEFTPALESFFESASRLGRIKKCFCDLPLVLSGEPYHLGIFDCAAGGLRLGRRFKPCGWDLTGHGIHHNSATCRTL